MKQLIHCKSCGAEFEEDLPKCPYCGTLNYKGAEQEYLNKLENIREGMEDLQEVPEDEVKKEIKQRGKFIGKVILIIGILIIGLALLLYWINRSPERDRKEDYLWMQENFPIMDELYEDENYEELMKFYLDKMEAQNAVWEWNHADFCNLYLNIMEINEILNMEEQGEEITRYDYETLFYLEWVVRGIPFRDDIDEEEEIRLEPYYSRILSDLESRWDMSQEDYQIFLEQIEKNHGMMNYEDCMNYVEEWYGREEAS